ncbi:MAG TPA: DeoR/GlpR transcriptional regulator [Chloroflexi bacterium]|nr:DeoR/GlpR transcriptional regulator [Chloroflexota bacterium]
MFKQERQDRILRILEKEKSVNVEDIAREFSVSAMTIRRDLQTLERQGLIERTHGGAVLLPRPQHGLGRDLMLRLRDQVMEKQAIARRIASCIGQSETIYLSPGTTTYYVAKALVPRKDIVVVTNSLLIAWELAISSDIEVIMLGGALRRQRMSLARIFVLDHLESLQVDRIIVGCEGIHHIHGITNNVPPEYGTDRFVIGDRRKAVVVADHTKVGAQAKFEVAAIDRVDALITTTAVPEHKAIAFEERGVRVERVPVV